MVPMDVENLPKARFEGDLFYGIHDLSRLVRMQFDQTYGRHGVTQSQWWMLMHVSQHEQASQSDLATIAGMGRAAAGELFGRMEEKHWIERSADVRDARIRRVRIAPAGVVILKLIGEQATEYFDKVLAGIEPEQLQITLLTINSIRANITPQ